jgi:hypothetical protein
MPEAMTYDSLVSDIAIYAERSDSEFLAQVPRFIMLAENRLASEFKGLGHVRIVNFELTQGNNVYEKPARWRETMSFFMSTGSNKKSIKNRSVEYIQTYWPDPIIEDVPEFYSDYDYDHFYIGPTPDGTYPASLTYYERPQPLDTTNQTNWTTRYAPQALLYASLLEAQPFLKQSERIAEFQGLYDRAIGIVSSEDSRRQSDSSARRSK